MTDCPFNKKSCHAFAHASKLVNIYDKRVLLDHQHFGPNGMLLPATILAFSLQKKLEGVGLDNGRPHTPLYMRGSPVNSPGTTRRNVTSTATATTTTDSKPLLYSQVSSLYINSMQHPSKQIIGKLIPTALDNGLLK